MNKCNCCENPAAENRKLCKTCADKRNTHKKVWREKQKSLGNCTNCGNKNDNGHTQCDECLLKQKQKFANYKKANQCLDCVVGIPARGCLRCRECLEKRRNKKQERITNGLCENCDNKVLNGCTQCTDCLEKRKNRKRYFVSNGICPNCEKFPSHKKSLCKACLIKLRERKAERKKSHLCTKCGLSCFNNSSFCETCYLKSRSWYAMKTTKFWVEIQQLFLDQKEICPYSGLKLVLGENAELDHIIPKSAGGSNDFENFQWVHRIVNRMKMDNMEVDFLQFVKLIYEHKGLQNYGQK